MITRARLELRAFISETLEKRGDLKPFADDESLFLSGRLDSLTMMNFVMFLEKTYGVDFDTIYFEVAVVDTVEAILALIQPR